MGMFDDLIPDGAQQSSAAPASSPAPKGMFDDLIPQAKPSSGPEIIPVEPMDEIPGQREFAQQVRAKRDRDLTQGLGQADAAVGSFLNTALLNVPLNIKAWKTGVPYETLKEREDALARQYPKTSMAGSVAGGLASAAAVPVAPAASLLGRAAQGAALGAGFSGLSEFADSKDPMQAAKAAGVGAALGGVAPPLVEGVARGIGALGRRASTVFRPGDEAAKRVGEALKRDAATGGQQLDDGALLAAQAAGQPAVVGDMGGETTRALARSAANTSPEARHALETVVSDRFEGQAPRVSQFIMGLGSGEDALSTREALKAAAAKANAPAYAKAYQEGAGGVWHEGLAQLAQAPDIAAAIKGATRTGANRAAVEGFRPIKNPFEVLDSGEVRLTDPKTVPNLQFWDHVKRNLDDRISSLKRAGENSAARDATALREQLVSYLDDAAPSYKDARSGAAAFFGAQDALEAGQKFVSARGKNSEYAAAIAKMSAPERKLFADGYASQLVAKINEAGDRRSVLNYVFNSPAERQRVNMALGHEKAKELEAFLHVEGLMDGLRTAVKGNSTTVRQLAEAGMAGGLGGLAGGVLSGGDIHDISIGALMGSLAKAGKIKIDQNVARRVGEMLASPDPKVFQKAVKMASRKPRVLEAIKSLDAYIGAAARPDVGEGSNE